MKSLSHVLESNRPGTKEPWFGKDRHLNAGSTKEVMVQMGKLMQSVARGEVTFNDAYGEEAQAVQQELSAAEKRDLLATAYFDRVTSSWAETGAGISATLYETAQRQGFMRRFLSKGEVEQGNIVRHNVRMMNVMAVVATGPSMNAPQFAAQRYIYPPEFYVTGNVRVEERDIAQGASDLLDEAFSKAHEQINVQEDRTYLSLLDRAVGLANPLMQMSSLTPATLASMRTEILKWGLSAENMLIAADYWTDLTANANAYGSAFDLVTQHEMIQTGYIGTLLGMSITTDGFRDPGQQVVAPSEMYLIASPINHGAYTDRSAVNATPVDSYADGVPARGWFFSELISQVVSNPRSSVKGKRS